MYAAHILVRMGYSHADVMEMEDDDVAEWMEHAKAYNKETGITKT